jgi:hypothetical protein
MQLFDAIDGYFFLLKQQFFVEFRPKVGLNSNNGGARHAKREWSNVCHTKLWS